VSYDLDLEKYLKNIPHFEGVGDEFNYESKLG
jgi:hypothetical protein